MQFIESQSRKLLEKINQYNTEAASHNCQLVNMGQVSRALEIATHYHNGQFRKTGEPYITHPIAVADMVSDYLFKTDIIITAILHDTLEDTTLTFEMIEKIFGEPIANQVMDLTRVKEAGRKISSSEMVDSLWLQKKYALLFVKQFDRLHNMQTIGGLPPEKVIKIIKETVHTFLVLAMYLEIPVVTQELIKLCYRNLGIIELMTRDHNPFPG